MRRRASARAGWTRLPRAGALALAAAAPVLAPGVAQACSVCFSGGEDSRVAFLVTTIFLTGLPLLLIGSLVWWLRRRLLQLEQPPGLGAASPRRSQLG